MYSMRAMPDEFYRRELSHVDVYPVEGKWVVEAVYMHGAGRVELELATYFDDVIFKGDDQDAVDEAMTCDHFVFDRCIHLSSRSEVAEHIRKSRSIPLSHAERLMMRRFRQCQLI